MPDIVGALQAMPLQYLLSMELMTLFKNKYCIESARLKGWDYRIRDEKSLNNIRQYIFNNPVQWEQTGKICPIFICKPASDAPPAQTASGR